jgi:DNA gyrase subunit B
MPAKKQVAKSYDAGQITELGFPEAIQRRPGMYIGGRSNLHHLLAEVVDNSIDEAMGGFCTRIDISLEADGSASVTDNGRGVPVAIHPESGKSALEMSFTQLHTGGKFDQDSYSTSGGLHGVGIKATNALSSKLEVEVQRDGVRYRQRYEHGYVKSPVEIFDPSSDAVIGEVGQPGDKAAIKKHADPKLPTGTKVRFTPSEQFMEVTRFDFSAIAHRLEVAAYLIPGLKLTLVDHRREEPRRREYHQEGGLLAYVAQLNEGRQLIHASPIKLGGQAGKAQIELVMQYHSGDEEEILSFVNTIPTSDGGTHVSGLRAALTKAINVFGQERKQIKSADSINGRDTMLGLTAAVSVLMPEPEFTSQTKTQLGNRELHGHMMSLVYEALLERFRAEPALGRKIVDRCLVAARAREAAAKARSLVMRKSILEMVDTGLPGKLADVVKNADTSRTIIYLVEGDSAGGSCKQARNNNYHAILPLRGKILNTERARLGKALSNNEIKAIVSALGAGVAQDFRVEDMRYGGVAIFVDADVDGLHIMTLLLTLFWRFMRPMIDAGRLYIARAPLYRLSKTRTVRYAYSDWERDQIFKQWGRKGVTVQRYKGLGEMNPSQLKETVFDVPDLDGKPSPFASPNLFRVTVDDAHRANQMVALWMGSSVEPRKLRLMQVWDEAADDLSSLDEPADALLEAGDPAPDDAGSEDFDDDDLDSDDLDSKVDRVLDPVSITDPEEASNSDSASVAASESDAGKGQASENRTEAGAIDDDGAVPEAPIKAAPRRRKAKPPASTAGQLSIFE